MAQGSSGKPRQPRGGPSRHQASTGKAQGRPSLLARATGSVFRIAAGGVTDGPGKLGEAQEAQGRSK